MPFHPVPEASMPQEELAESTDDAYEATAPQGPTKKPFMQPRASSNRDDESYDNYSAQSLNSNGFNPKALNGDHDDLMAESYEGAAVSYPVARVANLSIDEDAKASLQEQGLWNAPTMMAMQPSNKVMMMAETVEASRPSVPVQKPIAQFMASLENELGVSRDRLVKAFEQLTPGQMQMPPEQTMVQVIKNLNLDSTDESKALGMYSKMLAQMQMIDKKDQMPMANITVPPAGLLKPEAKEVASKYGQNLGPSNHAELKNQMVQVKPEAKEGIIAVPNDVSTSAEVSAPLVRAESKGQEFEQGQSQARGQGQESQTPMPQQALNQYKAHSESPKANVSGHEKSAQMSKLQTDTRAVLSDRKADLADAMSNVTTVDSNVVKAQPGSDLAMVGGSKAVSGLHGESRMDSKHEAIQSIINNAQMLAQKGGGEMKMTLKPEHLGEIQLKVAMDGPRVDIQMVTERSEVKKLIEQGAHELRHGLAQHSLSMEKLDVSVNDKTAGGFNQGRPDFGAAREFASQFNQQQENRREQILEGAAMRGDLASRVSTSRIMPPRQGVSSGRLNVVA